MKSNAFQKKYWSEFAHIWKESWVRNKIGLLWCHNHNELRLIKVEVNLSGISLTLYRGQFDSFLIVDNFHFVRFLISDFFIFCFLRSFLAFWGPIETFFCSGWGLICFLGFTNVNYLFLFLRSFSVFLGSIRLTFGLRWGPKSFYGFAYIHR